MALLPFLQSSTIPSAATPWMHLNFYFRVVQWYWEKLFNDVFSSCFLIYPQTHSKILQKASTIRESEKEKTYNQVLIIKAIV